MTERRFGDVLCFRETHAWVFIHIAEPDEESRALIIKSPDDDDLWSSGQVLTVGVMELVPVDE